MKLTSYIPFKLCSDLPQVRRPSIFRRVLLGSLVIFSLIMLNYHFQTIEQPIINIAAASPQTISPSPLFGNPASGDFLSYAIAIMPAVPGANLNTSNIAGSTNCDVLVPLTYIDAGCMNSLPLLFPFEEPQQINNTEPINETFYGDFVSTNSSVLDLSIGVASDNITAGETQTVTVTVSDQNSTEPITGALVLANVTDSFLTVLHEYSGTTDDVGQVSFPFLIPVDAATDVNEVFVLASADGYENASASTTFEVIGSGDFSFDNSTFDESFDDGSSDFDDSSDDCCDSDDNDFDSPTVKSTDPSNGDNNVPTDLSEIKVTFDESIDKDSIDSGSLSLFANNCGTVVCSTPNIQDVSVSSKAATFQIDQSSIDDLFTPGVTYIASISSSIQDEDGNFLDCFDSKGVDDSCEWDFSITDDNTPPTVVSTNPNNDDTGVPITSTITATFSEPMDSLTIDAGITFIVKNGAGTIIPGTILESNFLKTYTFTPTSLLSGSTSYTVTIKGGTGGVEDISGNSMTSSKEWKFTTAAVIVPPSITLDPDSGPAGTLVSVTGAGFDPTSTVTIDFGSTSDVTTNPSPLKTTATGTFIATFNVPPLASNGDYTVKATQGSKSASKTFTVGPVITLNPTSGPVSTPVIITGIGFSPSSVVTITFGGNILPESPVTTNSSGGFSLTFVVPGESSSGPNPVVATQGSNSASKIFTVTETSGLLATSRSNVSSFGANQSKATLSPPSINQSNATILVVTNNSFYTAESNGTIPLQNKVHSLNASSTLGTENTSTAPTVQVINNTSFDTSTGNTVKSNSPTSIATQNNDTSNSKSSEKSIPINPPTSNDQRTLTTLTKDNTSEIAQKESTNPLSDAKVKNKDISSKDTETASSDSVTEKPSSVTEDKTITKVKSPDNNNQPEKRSESADSSARDRALFYKYLNRDIDNDKVTSEQTEVNNRPVAINDEARTESNIPLKINILSNDKDPDGDKLSLISVSRPSKGTIESDDDGTITYSPLKSWSGTERFKYSISDDRGGVATSTVTVIVQNHPPEAEDQDVSVNANSPIKIKLEAKDPDDDKLKFVIVTKPSHGRIVQFSSSTGTLAYIPDENYDGKDDFAFKVHDGTEFSKDAKVSAKIEKNEKLSRDQVQQNDQQQTRERPSQPSTDEKKSSNDNSNDNDTPPSDSKDQSDSTQDDEQQKSDVKEEEKQSSESEKSTSDADTTSSEGVVKDNPDS